MKNGCVKSSIEPQKGHNEMNNVEKQSKLHKKIKSSRTNKYEVKKNFTRNDEFEGAVGTAMDIGATVLKVGFTKVGTFSTIFKISFVV